MSTIGVKSHNEDIHKIIKQPTEPLVKSPRYKSKIKIIDVADKASHRTLGLPHYEAPVSSNFLKKGTGSIHRSKFQPVPSEKKSEKPEIPEKEEKVEEVEKELKETKDETPESADKKVDETEVQSPKTEKAPKVESIEKSCREDPRRPNCSLKSFHPPIPKWKIECPKRSDKDFVSDNIKWVSTLQPKIPYPRTVDSPRGTVKDLKHLIEMIKIREREEYGKVPGYLCVRKKQLNEQLERKKRKKQIEREYREKMGMAIRDESEEEEEEQFDSKGRHKIRFNESTKFSTKESERIGTKASSKFTRKESIQFSAKESQKVSKKETMKEVASRVPDMGENYYMVDKETRQRLLEGLKENWNDLSKQFLRLPVMCDTMTKIRRKAWLEQEIERVEKDIRLVESHPYIYLERRDNRRTSDIAHEMLLQQEELEKQEKEERKRKKKEVAENVQEAPEDPKEEETEVEIRDIRE